jgi:ATP-dependent exoDNAse (exonuclease V) alpha subunit
MRHFDYGYAVTSHSSQGLTSERVLVNMDTEVHPKLLNGRFAYVSVARASQNTQIFTNDQSTLAERLNRDVSKTSTLTFEESRTPVPKTIVEQTQALANKPAAGLELAL